MYKDKIQKTTIFIFTCLLLFLFLCIREWSIFKNYIGEQKKIYKEQEDYLALTSELFSVLLVLNQPSNDIFYSKDVDFEKLKYERTKVDFEEKLNMYLKMTQSLNRESIFKKGVMNLNFLLKEHGQYVEKTFFYFDQKKIMLASKEMSKADEVFSRINFLYNENLYLINKKYANDNGSLQRRIEIQYVRLSFIFILLIFIFFGMFYYIRKLGMTVIQNGNELMQKNHDLQSLEDALNFHAIISKADIHGKITYVNKRFEEVSGFNLSEILGKDHRILNSAHHSSHFFKNIWKTILDKKPWRGQIKNKKKGGGYYWVDSTITPILGIDGEIKEFISIRQDITDQKNIEEEVSVRKKFFENVIENMEEAVIVNDIAGNIILLNAVAIELLGVEANNSTNVKMLDLFWCDKFGFKLGPKNDELPFVEIFKKKQPLKDILCCLRKNNELIYLSFSSSLLLTGEQSHYSSQYSLSIVNDVTEKIQQMVLDNLSEKIKSCYIDIEDDMENFSRFCSNELLEYFQADSAFFGTINTSGLSDSVVSIESIVTKERLEAEELEWVKEEKIFLDENLKVQLGIQMSTLAKHLLGPMEMRKDCAVFNYLDDKNFITITLTNRDRPYGVIFISNPKNRQQSIYSVGFQTLLNQINELIYRKILDVESRYNLKILDLVIQSSGISLIKIDHAKNTVKINGKWEDQLGIKTYEIPTKLNELYDLFGENFQSSLNKYLSLPKGNFEQKIIVESSKGSAVPFLIKGRILSVGRSEYFVGLQIDLTYIEMLEHDLAIQKEVAEKQQRLISLGELAAGVGHEINNPLTIIQNFIYRILDEKRVTGYSFDKEEKYLTSIANSVDRIKGIVKGLKKVSRESSKGKDIIKVAGAIEEVIFMLKEIYISDKIEILYENKCPDAMISIANGKLEQVLMNLISNARDALIESNKSDKKILVLTDQIGESVYISVKDNALGIPDSIKDKIFNPFFTTKDVGHGTGLGLFIIQEIVQDFNGEITLDSIIGEGSCFKIRIPLFNKTGEDIFGTTEVKAKLGSKIHDKKILIVEDEDLIREILSDICQSLGMLCTMAENGVVALEKLEQDKFDLVITDIMMPRMNGIEFLKTARSSQLLNETKVIFSTGGSTFEIEKLMLNNEIVDIIYKPFDEEIVKAKLLNHLPAGD